MFEVINRNYAAKIEYEGTLDNWIVENFPNAKLYYKPKMAKIKLGDKTVLLFNSFNIRIMGRGTNHESILKHTFKSVKNIRLMSMTVKMELGFKINLHNQRHRDIIDTRELFPALKLYRNDNINVNIFASGKCILTGVHNLRDVIEIRLKLLEVLQR